MDNLYTIHEEIMSKLNTFQSYEDPTAFFQCRLEVTDGQAHTTFKHAYGLLEELLSEARIAEGKHYSRRK